MCGVQPEMEGEVRRVDGRVRERVGWKLELLIRVDCIFAKVMQEI